jgi:anti-sigma factor RsiW
MSCDRIEDLLAAYAEGELGAEDRAFVEEHLRTCAGCAELLGLLKAATESLAAFPEIELRPALRTRLRAIPVRKKRFLALPQWMAEPSLQPVFAAASLVLVLFSFYMFNPDKQHINNAVGRLFHRGVGTIEKIYAQAGTVTDALSGYAENVLVSLEKVNPLKRNEGQPK